MQCRVQVVVFCLLIPFVLTENLDQFYNYVTAKIAEIQAYTLPTNNEKLFKTDNSTVHDFGNFDFIIIGGGAAGSVLANRLSEISSWKILLLEAGGETDPFSDIPLFRGILQQTDMNWGYFTTPQTTCCLGMNNNQCEFPRGKVIGGSTTINGAIYSRGSHSDYDNWAELGNTGWEYNNILRYFKKSEHVVLKSYDPGYHGHAGELYVNHTAPPSIISQNFIDANKEKHLKELDYNGRKDLGVSRIQFNQIGNKHQNAAYAFLDNIKSRPNLKIVLNAGVNKIILDKDKARGVTFILNKTAYKATANKEVILSAGAINSPQLLMVSGIGPKDDLEKLDIPVEKNLPAVGKNLQDHPTFSNLYFRTNFTFTSPSLRENLARYLEGKTPFTNVNGIENLAFINSDRISSGEVDLEYLSFAAPLIPWPINTGNYRQDISQVYTNYNVSTDIAILVALMKSRSKGKVTLKSKNMIDFPLIDINYYSDPNNEDIETMYKGIKYVLSLADTKAFRSINATFIGKQPQICENLKNNDREYWYCALRHMTNTEYHPAGTTKMGLSKWSSVVNTNCVVHGYKNLRVVDAGVIPEITKGHLMATVYMIAERISDVIKDQYHHCK